MIKIILLLFSIVAVGNSQTSAGFVAAKFAAHAAGTQITTCHQALSVDNTTYYLATDLTCSDYAVTPTGDNITIDLGGHTLTACGTPNITAILDDTITKGSGLDFGDPRTDTVFMGGANVAGITRGPIQTLIPGTPHNPQGSSFAITSIEKIGDTSGASDYTPNVDFVSTTYLSGHGTYIFPGAQINWFGPHQPTTTYHVAYHFSEPCAAIWFSASEAALIGATSIPLSGSNLKTLTVKNGNIRTLGAAPYSAGVHLSSGGTAQVVFDTLQIFTDSIAGNCIYAPLNNVTYKNVICYNGGTGTYIRDHFDLSGISSSNNQPFTLLYDITGIISKGSSQAGIFNQVPGINIHDNVLSSGLSYYSNDFEIQNFGNSVNIYNNFINCSVASGQGCRGIGATTPNGTPATNINIHDNVVITRELPNNLEYGEQSGGIGVKGCQSHGTYAIQYDTIGSGAVQRNTGTAQAKECDAHALRITSTPIGATTTSDHNIFTASRISSVTTKAYALSFDDCEGGTFGAGDVFTGDSGVIFVDSDGSKNCLVKGATLTKGTNPDATYATIFISRQAGSPPCTGGTDHCNLFVQDVTFANGAALSDTSIDQTTGGQPFDVVAYWSYTPTIVANSSPLSGATVIITDNLGHTNTYTTDSSGLLTGGSTMASTVFAPFNAAVGGIVALPQIRYFNVASGSVPSSEVSNPYSIMISKSGCTTLNYNLTITALTTITKTVSCP